MMVSNRNLLFQGSIFRFHVCFGGCKGKIDCGYLLSLRIPRTLQWKGERTCIIGVGIGPQNDASFEGPMILGDVEFTMLLLMLITQVSEGFTMLKVSG